MSTKGFIKIDRKIEDWYYWDNLTMIGFWIHILMRARWEDGAKIKRGEFLTTYDGLAEECGISRTTVWRYLKQLQETGEVKVSRSGNKIKVRIPNWDKYQMFNFETSAETSVETSPETSAETSGEKAHPYIYERKEERKKGRYMVVNPTIDQIREYIYTENLMVDPDRFFDYYESQGWKLSNGNKMKDWKASCRNWHRKEVEKMNQEKKKGLAF